MAQGSFKISKIVFLSNNSTKQFIKSNKAKLWYTNSVRDAEGTVNLPQDKSRKYGQSVIFNLLKALTLHE